MLRVKHISFGYNKTSLAVKGVSFVANPGEHVSIIGKSGSGKTTLLKLLYGFYDLSEGEILWNKKKILGPKYHLVIGPEFIKYVSQAFDLNPFITVEEAVGKHLSNFYLKRKAIRSKELLELVELIDYQKTLIKNLSGGQKQRVALASALAKEPEILLLDEPFSHIDTFQKQALRRRLFSYLKAQDSLCLVATHDKEDVLGFADKILVLDQGKVIESGDPEKLYKAPEHEITAAFFDEFTQLPPYGIFYAHQVKRVPHSPLKATVKQSFFKGRYYLIEAKTNGSPIFFEHSEPLDSGTVVYLEIEKN